MPDLTCPQCGSPEMNAEGTQLYIRAYKVEENGRWWSNCLICPVDADGESFWF